MESLTLSVETLLQSDPFSDSRGSGVWMTIPNPVTSLFRSSCFEGWHALLQLFDGSVPALRATFLKDADRWFVKSTEMLLSLLADGFCDMGASSTGGKAPSLRQAQSQRDSS